MPNNSQEREHLKQLIVRLSSSKDLIECAMETEKHSLSRRFFVTEKIFTKKNWKSFLRSTLPKVNKFSIQFDSKVPLTFFTESRHQSTSELILITADPINIRYLIDFN